MYVLTADEIRQVENNCFDGYSTEAQLMLKAGTACYDAVMKYCGTDIFSKRIFVLCGNGKMQATALLWHAFSAVRE